MASIRSRDGKWQVRVTRRNHAPVSKTFSNKTDAVRWARAIESDMDQGKYKDPSVADRLLFKDVISRYIEEVLTDGHREDIFRLKALSRNWIGKLSMLALTPPQLAKYRDERLKSVSAGTLIREFAYISSSINHARREWAIPIENPVPLVRKPSSPPGRNRILTDEELERFFKALERRRIGWQRTHKHLAEFARKPSRIISILANAVTCFQAKDRTSAAFSDCSGRTS